MRFRILIPALLISAAAGAADTKLIYDSEKTKPSGPIQPGEEVGLSEKSLNPKASSGNTEVVLGALEEQKVPPRVQVIVDGSGSMAEELEDDKTKMFYSKKLLSRYLMEQWKEKAEVSLRVYGARRTKDCKDNYRAVPFRARSLDDIARKVSVIEPVGKTPIAESLKEAYKDLKSYSGPKRVVLLTDGQETCGGDPCELVKKLQADGTVDLKIYVVAIGMDPNSDEAKGLQCLGDVSFANDEGEMFASLGDISQQMNKGNNLFVENPNPTSPVTVYQIMPNGDRVAVRTFTAAFGTRMEPGRYSAEVRVEPPFEFPEFVIPKGQSVTLKVKGNGLIEVKFVKALASVELYDQEDKLAYRLESDRPYYVVSGRYKLRILAPPFFRRDIRKYYVYPNAEYRLDLKKDAGVVQFAHPATQGIYVFSSDKLLGNYVTNVPFVLPNGTYRLFLDKECDVKKVAVGESPNVKNVRCQDAQPATARKKKGPSLR